MDADLVRLCYKTIAENGGEFVPDRLRENYVSFMTTPGNYNDCSPVAFPRMELTYRLYVIYCSL